MMNPARPARTAEPLRWHRAAAIGMSALFFIYAAYSTWRNYFDPPGVDFVSFWAAGRLALEGQAASAYDVATHRAVELTAGPVKGLLPFPYPPPFLLFVTPFALLPFWIACVSWVALTATLYYLAFRRIARWPYIFALPASAINALIGQNGLLTSAIFMTGAARLEGRPFVAGAILGLLAIKPQLALLLPVAVLAGRLWAAAAGAIASTLVMTLLAYAAFGAAAYQAFIEFLPRQAELASGPIPWNEMASVFAAARFAGLPNAGAILVHGLVAAAAAAATWIAWSRKLETRVPILAAATLLVPPYILTYDSLLLMVPLGWLVQAERRPGTIALLWLLTFLPMAAFWGVYPGPNTVPAAAMLAIYAMYREARPAAADGTARHAPMGLEES